MAGAYSFADVQCAITGPGGTLNVSEGGIAEEGITVAMRDPKNTVAYGADGTPMHSLRSSKGGTVTIRVQKTSPLNAQLDVMYRYQTQSSANHGRNTITISNPAAGDSVTCQACAFQKRPDYNNPAEAGSNEWVFDAGVVDEVLGSGLSF